MSWLKRKFTYDDGIHKDDIFIRVNDRIAVYDSSSWGFRFQLKIFFFFFLLFICQHTVTLSLSLSDITPQEREVCHVYEFETRPPQFLSRSSIPQMKQGSADSILHHREVDLPWTKNVLVFSKLFVDFSIRYCSMKKVGYTRKLNKLYRRLF